MKRMFLTSVAVLFLATGTAHADTLPDTMIGKWCYSTIIPDEQQTPTQLVLTRRVNQNCSANNSVIIHQDGSDDEDGSCIFDKIEQIRANVFVVYHRCRGGGEENSDNNEGGSGPKTFEIINGKLIITSLSEG
jgi:hypothetical protein